MFEDDHFMVWKQEADRGDWMMRNLYLVRHGRVDFPGGIHRCIGRTDIGLDETGKNQARALAGYFKQHPLECIFSSPLSRAVETATLLRDSRYPLEIEENLVELDMGEWENLPLKDIKKELETEPVYGEKRKDGYRRFAACIEEILKRTSGDIAVVAHAGINCCYLSQLLGTPLETSRALPQPYGGFSRIEICDSGKEIAELGRMASETPSLSECERIWERYHTAERVRSHCRAVSELALEYGRRLQKAGYPVDLELIRSAALLHDVLRQKEDHPLEGAKAVIREGYPKLASLILRHHDWYRTMDGSGKEGPFLPDKASGAGWLPEAAILYLADKEMFGTVRVTLEERFSQSQRHCLKSSDVPAALAAHKRRYQEAKSIEARLQACLGMR